MQAYSRRYGDDQSSQQQYYHSSSPSLQQQQYGAPLPQYGVQPQQQYGMQKSSSCQSSKISTMSVFGQDPFFEITPSHFQPGTDPNIVESFNRIDRDGNGVVDDKELQAVLSSFNNRFSMRTVHLLMFQFTHSNQRRLGPKEFVPLINCLQSWRTMFQRFDRDRNGSIDSSELGQALNNLGFTVSPVIVNLLIAKFNKSGGRFSLPYDNFIECCLTVKEDECSNDHHYGVWIMKEYGVQRSWTQMYKILFPEPIPMFNIGRHQEPIPAALRPISFSKDKKEIFFMVLFSHLVSYDLENKMLHSVVHYNNQFVAWDMLVYEETLTSPFVGSNNGDDHEESLDLPEHIITDILLRLPVKCLLCFKSVSWSWYDLITNSSFVTLQVEWSRKTSPKLHIVYNNGSFSLRHAEFDSFDGDTSLDHPLIGEHHNTIVVGVSDGLLCLCDLSSVHLTFPLALYNPTTRSSNVLPTSLLDGFSMDYEHFFGFGYDVTNDDYKVVKIAQVSRRSEHSFHDYAQVYSLNTNSWKWVTTSPFRLGMLQLYSGVCVNGVVHWVCSSDNNERLDDAIVGFDIAAETYSLVPQPQSLEPLLGRRCFLNLGFVDGCLCQVCNFLDHHFHDVWIMREYGVQSSWSKLFRIVNDEPGPEILKPKSFSSDKKELLFSGFLNYLVMYNVEEKRLRRCGPEGIRWDAHIYEETLVSADAGNVHWEEQGRVD